jgi:hypothetical protein
MAITDMLLDSIAMNSSMTYKNALPHLFQPACARAGFHHLAWWMAIAKL